MTSSASNQGSDGVDSYSSQSVNQVIVSRDRSLIGVCTTHGLSLIGTGSFKKSFQLNSFPESVSCSDMLGGTSLCVVVFESSCFQMFNVLTKQAISPRVSVGAPILNIKINPKRVLVLTTQKLIVFDLRKLEILLTVDRREGLEAVSSGLLVATDDGFCALPVSGGAIQLIDTYTLVRMRPVRAHNSPVTALEMNDKFLLTASSKGTVIRVFSLPSLELLGLFRRGRTESPIRSLSLSSDGSLLAVTGDSDTAHIFRISDIGGVASPKSSSSSSPPAAVLSSAYQSVLNFFPKQYKDAIEAVRDFATVKLRRENNCQFKYISSVLGQSKGSGQVVVVSEGTGFAFVYDCNLTKGGECKLRSEYALLSSSEEPLVNVPLVKIVPQEVIPLPVVLPKSKTEAPVVEAPREDTHSSSVSRTDSADVGDGSPSSEFVVASKRKKKKKKKVSSDNFDSE